MYCRKTYFVSRISVWVLKWNSGNNLATCSIDPFFPSLEINTKLFCILLLSPKFSLSNIRWKFFHDCSLSQVKLPSYTITFIHEVYPPITNPPLDINGWPFLKDRTQPGICSLSSNNPTSTSAICFEKIFSNVYAFSFFSSSLSSPAIQLTISTEHKVQIGCTVPSSSTFR